MGIRDKFAEQYARQKTMSGPEKKAHDIIGKLMMKKVAPFFILLIVFLIIGVVVKVPWWGILIADVLVAVAAYFYMKKAGQKYQEFLPYVGNLISVDKKNKDEYVLLIKQGKKPVKLDVKYGGEDFVKVKRNSLVQVSYNPEGKIAILVTKQ